MTIVAIVFFAIRPCYPRTFATDRGICNSGRVKFMLHGTREAPLVLHQQQLPDSNKTVL